MRPHGAPVDDAEFLHDGGEGVGRAANRHQGHELPQEPPVIPTRLGST